MSGLQWFKTRKNKQNTEVFDPIRKKYVTLTPEEEVRQMVLRHLVEQLDVPAGLIAVEYSMKLNQLEKRCDIVVFSPETKPWMIVECKAKHIVLTQAALDQIIRYNMSLNAAYLLITNGITQYSIRTDSQKNSIEFLDYVPTYNCFTEK